MTKTKQTKQGTGGVTLVRFVDADNPRDIRNAPWHSDEAFAEKSWMRRRKWATA